jgi:hypothetical protein
VDADMQAARQQRKQLKLPPLNLLSYGTFAKHSTAYRISHQICGAPWHKTPCAYIWVPFQLRRLLVAIGLDLRVMRVHGAGAYDTTISPACNQTQHPRVHGCVRLGSAVYPL